MYPIKNLSDILAVLRNGKSCKQTDNSNGNMITRIETISAGVINEERVGYFPLTEEDKEKYSIKKGDILFSHINSVEHIGKIALSGKDYDNLFHGMNLLLLRGNHEIINGDYLYVILQYYFKSGYWRDICKKAINQASLNQKNLNEIRIPLPPLSTQSRIVAKLDEAFGNIDKQIELLKGNIEDVINLNSGLLEALLKEDEFEMKTVEEISKDIQYGYTGKTKEIGKYKLLRITDIQDNKINWETVPFVEITDKEADKYKLNCGDIVFARTGATVGKSCLINNDGVGEIFASYLIRIIGNPEVMIPEFMQYFFYSSFYWRQISDDVVGAAQPNFNGSKLKKVRIPLPSIIKQKEIIGKLNDLNSRNSILKSEYEAQVQDLEILKQSLLEEAFAGRLISE